MSHAHDRPCLPMQSLRDHQRSSTTRSGTLVERLLFNNRLVDCGDAVRADRALVLGYQALGLSLNAAYEKMIPTEAIRTSPTSWKTASQLAGMGNSLAHRQWKPRNGRHLRQRSTWTP